MYPSRKVKIIFYAAVLLTALALSSCTPNAVTVFMKDGDVLNGNLEEVSGSAIRIEQGGTPLSLSAGDVKYIVRGSNPGAIVLLGLGGALGGVLFGAATQPPCAGELCGNDIVYSFSCIGIGAAAGVIGGVLLQPDDRKLDPRDSADAMILRKHARYPLVKN